jgi:hypothetical protein
MAKGEEANLGTYPPDPTDVQSQHYAGPAGAVKPNASWRRPRPRRKERSPEHFTGGETAGKVGGEIQGRASVVPAARDALPSTGRTDEKPAPA